MKRFLLYGHGGAYNHGAEAIVKTTIGMIREKYGKSAHIAISSHFPEQDKEYSIDADVLFSPIPEVWAKEKLAEPAAEREGLAREMYREALDFITSDTVCLSVGGDNFCYPNWHRQAVFQQEAVGNNAKSILWGCSIEPSAFSPEMTGTLNTYTHILARESRTYNALQDHRITADIQLIPDPEILLEPEPVDLPEQFQIKNTVGINISPLLIRNEKIPGIIKGNIRSLIDYVLTKTDMTVALIPHVVMPMDNDYNTLREIECLFSLSFPSRLWLADEKYSASELKFIISQCELLVCARTHASIAAYSSGVPALVIGYSVKAAGIGEDLGLGELVQDVSMIKSRYLLRNMFINLYEQLNDVKNILSNKCQYFKQARRYMDYI